MTVTQFCLGICCLVDSRWKEAGKEGGRERKGNAGVWVVFPLQPSVLGSKPSVHFPHGESKCSTLRTQKSTGLKVAQRSVCTFSQRTQWGQDTFQQQKDKSWRHKWNRSCEVYMRPALKTPSSHKTERNRQKASKEPADGTALQVGAHNQMDSLQNRVFYVLIKTS